MFGHRWVELVEVLVVCRRVVKAKSGERSHAPVKIRNAWLTKEWNFTLGPGGRAANFVGEVPEVPVLSFLLFIPETFTASTLQAPFMWYYACVLRSSLLSYR